MSSMEVTLSSMECRHAIQIGVERRLKSLLARTHEIHGAAHDGDYWTIDLEAAAGELAVAKALGVFYGAKDTAEEDRSEGDVAGMQVRHSRHRLAHLLLHHRDDDGQVFILVTGTMPTFTIQGWTRAADSKLDEFWQESPHRDRECFWVPQEELRSFADLAA